MSVNANEQVDETVTDETESQQVETSQTSDQSAESGGEENTQFNPAEIEERYGLSPGELAEFKDEDSALAYVSNQTDAILSAGFSLQDAYEAPAETAPTQQIVQQQSVTQKIAKNKAAQVEKSELDAANARMDRIEAMLKQQQEAAVKQFEAQLDAAMQQRIDTWKSPTYGIAGGSRKFHQTKATKEIKELAKSYALTLHSKGKAVPDAGTILENIRLHHDPHFEAKKSTKPAAAAVGTPGTKAGLAAKNTEAPNIHMAYMKNPN